MGRKKTLIKVRKLLDLAWERHSAAFHEEVMDYYQEAIGLARNCNEDKMEAEIYDRMGLYFLNNNNGDEARRHFGEALRIKLDLFGQYHPEIAQSYNNIGLSFGQLKRHKEELEYLERSLEVLLKIKFRKKDEELALRYNNMGVCFGKLEQYDKQLEFLQLALETNLKTFGAGHPSVAPNYLNIGRYHRTHKNFDKALFNYHKAGKIYTDIFPRGHKYLTGTNNAIGEICFLKNEYPKALEYFQKAIFNECRPGIDPESVENPELGDLRISANLFSAFRLKGKTLLAWYRSEPEKLNLLDAALSVYRRVNELIHYTRRSLNADDSKLILAEKAHLIYEDAIAAAFLMHQKTGDKTLLEEAFHFSENSKALILLSSMKDAGAKVYSDIPKQLLNDEQSLRNELALISKKILNESLKNKDEQDSKKVTVWESEQFRLRQKSLELIRKLEKEFPQYYNLKYQTDPVTLEALQNALKRRNGQKVIVEYFLGEHHLFIFLLTANRFEAIQLKRPPGLEKTIRQFETGLSANLKKMFEKASAELFQWLIRPFAEFIEKGCTLQFIADGLLHNIPFESLLKCTGENTNGEYLILSHPVSYQYSAALWYFMIKNRAKPKRNKPSGFLGVAPVTFVNSETTAKALPDLEGSVFEVSETRALFEKKGMKAKTLLKQEATKSRLSDEISNYQYVLISTHGFVEKDQPSLSGVRLFSAKDDVQEGRFYVADAYNLDLNSDLIVLSACESGIGTLCQGEGMIALNRGFLLAGSQNVIYSLFKVPEKATRELIKSFFNTVLKQKDETDFPAALRKAKISLIEKGESPYQWAGFALIGV